MGVVENHFAQTAAHLSSVSVPSLLYFTHLPPHLLNPWETEHQK